MIAYIIRSVATNKMVDNGVAGACFEGADGQERANELVAIRNKLYSNDMWYVSEEVAG